MIERVTYRDATHHTQHIFGYQITISFPENSFSAGTGVNTGICNSNGPGGVANCHFHVFLICQDIISLQNVSNNAGKRISDVVGELVLPQHFQQWLHIRLQ